MADTKTSALTEATALTAADFAHGVVSAADRKWTFGTLAKMIATGAIALAAGALTVSSPMALTQTWNAAGVTFTGLLVNVTDTASDAASMLMDLQVGAASRASLSKNAALVLTTPTGGGSVELKSGSVWPVISRAGDGGLLLGFSGAATTAIYLGSTNLEIHQEASNVLALRKSTNAQAFRLYNTYTDASNYERGGLRWASNVLEVFAEAAGTGTARGLSLVAAGVTVYRATGVPLSIDTNNQTNTRAINITQGDGAVGIGFNGSAFIVGGSSSGKAVYNISSANTRIAFSVSGGAGGGSGTHSCFLYTADAAAGNAFKNIVHITAQGAAANLLNCTQADASTEVFVVPHSGAIRMAALPTSDPVVAGGLWNDSGTVKVSAG